MKRLPAATAATPPAGSRHAAARLRCSLRSAGSRGVLLAPRGSVFPVPAVGACVVARGPRDVVRSLTPGTEDAPTKAPLLIHSDFPFHFSKAS